MDLYDYDRIQYRIAFANRPAASWLSVVTAAGGLLLRCDGVLRSQDLVDIRLVVDDGCRDPNNGSINRCCSRRHHRTPFVWLRCIPRGVATTDDRMI